MDHFEISQNLELKCDNWRYFEKWTILKFSKIWSSKVKIKNILGNDPFWDFLKFGVEFGEKKFLKMFKVLGVQSVKNIEKLNWRRKP